MIIYQNDLASVIESIYTDSELSINISESDTLVNPTNDGAIGKTIIFSYKPYPDIDLNKLSKFNNIISRVPIECDNYIFEPYDIKFETKRIKFTSRVSKVLSFYNLKSTEFNMSRGVLKMHRYRLATDLRTDGYLNVTGLIAKLMGVMNLWRDTLYVVRKLTHSFIDNTKIFDPDSVYRKSLRIGNTSYDLCTEDRYFIGPMIRARRPDKRMNVKHGYFYGKFKTYRITDSVRSLDINYNIRDGFHIFYINKSELDPDDVTALVNGGGLEFMLYLLYYFCKKNHFNQITGDVLAEPLQYLVDPNGKLSLHISLFPMGLVDDSSTFYLSLLGMNK